MRVALVIERFEPDGGGVEAVAWNAAGALAARGAEVHVVARTAADHPEVATHTVPVPTFWQPLRVLAFSRAAAGATRALGCDVVQSFSRTRHQDVFRTGGGSHADYLERSHGPVASRLRRISPRHAVLLAMDRAVFADPRQMLLCNSAMVRDELVTRHGVPAERLVVIPNGVDLERFNPAHRSASREPLRAEFETGEEPAWLLAGSGFRRKGLETALEALAQSSEGVLWVAGRDDPAPWKSRASDLGVASRVRFLGPRRDLGAVYTAADALLLPTRYDAFANVCLEALASGLPVVTSGTNGAAGVLGEAGVVVADPEDAAGFAKALDRMRDPAARGAAARAARPIAEAFSWDAHAEALLQLYERLRS